MDRQEVLDSTRIGALGFALLESVPFPWGFEPAVMMGMAFPTMIAVDVGNSRLKAARFDVAPARLLQEAKLPEPGQVVSIELNSPHSFDDLQALLPSGTAGDCPWVVSSVNDAACAGVQRWLERHGRVAVDVLREPGRLPLKVELAAPEKVGIDRLLNAVAVNRVRPQGQPAIIVDAGSAITVDAVSAGGAFLGGAILAGPALQARALAEFTEKLPLLEVPKLRETGTLSGQPAGQRKPAGARAPVPLSFSTPALGRSTPQAMQAGLLWGTVGAVKELTRRLAAELAGEPLVVLTGGASGILADRLDRPVCGMPHLTLQGICLAQLAQSAESSEKAALQDGETR